MHTPSRPTRRRIRSCSARRAREFGLPLAISFAKYLALRLQFVSAESDLEPVKLLADRRKRRTRAVKAPKIAKGMTNLQYDALFSVVQTRRITPAPIHALLPPLHCATSASARVSTGGYNRTRLGPVQQAPHGHPRHQHMCLCRLSDLMHDQRARRHPRCRCYASQHNFRRSLRWTRCCGLGAGCHGISNIELAFKFVPMFKHQYGAEIYHDFLELLRSGGRKMCSLPLLA